MAIAPFFAASIYEPNSAAQSTAEPSAPSAFERVCTVAVLFYLSGAIVPLLFGITDAQEGGEASSAESAIKAVIYLIVGVFICLSWRSFKQAAFKVKVILLPVMFAFVSMFWSQYPLLTLRGSAVLAATTATGVYFGCRYTIPQQLRLLAYSLVLAIIGSYIFALFLPRYGLEQQTNVGDWRGVFIQKNNLAKVAVTAVLVFYFLRPWMNRQLRWFAIVAALLLLVLTASDTGFVVGGVLFLMLPLYRLARLPIKLAIPAIAALMLLLTIATTFLVNDPKIALQAVNRSADLTGRTELWAALWPSIDKRPWFGWGFSAFWLGLKGESELVLQQAGWIAGYAHNGFLDVIVQMGYAGLALFLIGYALLWWRAITYRSRSNSVLPTWFCTYLAMMALYNLTEGTILEQNSLYWAVYISNAVSLVTASATDRTRLREPSS